MADTPKTVDEYINTTPEAIRPRLEELRALIRTEVPEAAEKISWAMPTYTLNGNLVHFAAHKNHIGLYPGPEAIVHFAKQLEGYKTSKGAVQLPNSQPLPKDLLRTMLEWMVAENQK